MGLAGVFVGMIVAAFDQPSTSAVIVKFYDGHCVEMVLIVQTVSYINYELSRYRVALGMGCNDVICDVTQTLRVPRG